MPSFVSGSINHSRPLFFRLHFVENGELVKGIIYDFFTIVGSHVAFDAQFAAYSVRQFFKLVCANDELVNFGVNFHEHLDRVEYAAK